MINVGRFRGSAVLALLLGFTGSIASASVMFGSGSGFNSPPIYTVNQDTGAAATVGPSGVFDLEDLASDWRPGSYRVWAVQGVNGNRLLRVNPTTGACTVVGTFGTPITEIAFDVVTGQMYGTSLSPSTLYRIDPDTAAMVLVGSTGRANLDFYGLGFDLQGNLFGIDNTNDTLYRINTTTGATTAVGPTGVSSEIIVDLAARPEDGAMFGCSTTGGQSIYRINTTTGAATLVGPSNVTGGINGLAFSPIPEPTSAALLTVPAVAMLRRRRPRSSR